MSDVKTSWAELTAMLHDIGNRGSEDPRHFNAIPERLPDLIRRLVLYEDSPGEKINLVHYTSFKNAVNMFSPNQDCLVLMMYNYELANDPDEGRIKPPAWKCVEEEVKSWLNEQDNNHSKEDMVFDGNTYGFSFSAGSSDIEDDLIYWRLYGNDGQGCSLMIPVTSHLPVYKIRYRDRNGAADKGSDDEEVATRLRKILEIGKEMENGAPCEYRSVVIKAVAEGLLTILYGYYHLIKHVAYEKENEWRMIRVMPKQNEIRYDTTLEGLVKRYVEAPVTLKELLITKSEITIGPTVPNRDVARAYFEHLAKKHEMGHVTVKNSRQTYRQSPSPRPKQE